MKKAKEIYYSAMIHSNTELAVQAIQEGIDEHRADLLAECERLKGEVENLRIALHDIFEDASRQKSNRNCSVDEGLIATAKSAVRVIRRVCDENKSTITSMEAALIESTILLRVAVRQKCHPAARSVWNNRRDALLASPIITGLGERRGK